MAGYSAIAAVGTSLARSITHAFAARQPIAGRIAKAALIRTEDLGDAPVLKNLIGDVGLSVLLYRIDFNKTMRAAWSAASDVDGRGHLALDLHYLMTPWAENAEHQHMIMGRAMQALEESPSLSGATLFSPPQVYADEPQATATDSVQVLLEEISTEALMRTFDSLPSDYRLSVPYVARVVRIDTRGNLPTPVVDAQTRLRSAT